MDRRTYCFSDNFVAILNSRLRFSINTPTTNRPVQPFGSNPGVEFDTWHNSFNNDPDSNHLGIDINGNVNHGTNSDFTLPIATRFDDGNVWHAWVDYDGTTLQARVNQTGIRSANADLSRALDLTAILGQDIAYVGFTSGTGADWGNHDIIQWEYRDSFDPIGTVPEPSSLILWSSGTIGLLSWRTRRRV